MAEKLRVAVILASFIALTAWADVPSPSSIATPPQPQWTELSVEQRTILAPLSDDWDAMEYSRQKKWLGITRRFATMTPEEQRRIQGQMQEWGKLTPEQRRLAREKLLDCQQAPDREEAGTEAKMGGVLQSAGRGKGKATAASCEQAGTQTRAAAQPRPASCRAGPEPRCITSHRYPCPGCGNGSGQSTARSGCSASERLTRQALMSTVPAVRWPGILRRLASMGYEGLLLAAVLAVLLVLPHVLLGAFAHRLASPVVVQTHCFLVLLIYFLWFWSHGGQTLAMKPGASAWSAGMVWPSARRKRSCATFCAGPASSSEVSESSGHCSIATDNFSTIAFRARNWSWSERIHSGKRQRLSTHQIIVAAANRNRAEGVTALSSGDQLLIAPRLENRPLSM
jgi:hypothetical protein